MFLGRYVLDGVLSFSALPKLFKPLLESKSRKPPAPKLMGELLASIRGSGDESGDETLIEAFQADPIDLKIFWPADQLKDDTLNDWMDLYGLNALKPGGHTELELEFGEFLGQHQDLEQWIDVRQIVDLLSRNTL
jgi:hypothetical protein